MIRSDAARSMIVSDLRHAATQLEARAFLNVPSLMREAADELESLPRVISRRKLKRLRKKGKV